MVTLLDWIRFTGRSTLTAVRKAQRTGKKKDADFAKALLAFRQTRLQPDLTKYETRLKNRSFDEALENGYIKLKHEVQYAREKMQRYQTLADALNNSTQTLPAVNNTRIEKIKTLYDTLSEKIAIIKENQLNIRVRIKGKNSLQEASKALEKDTLDYNTIALLQQKIIALQPEMTALKKQLDQLHSDRVYPFDNKYIKAQKSLQLVCNKMEKYMTLWSQIQEKPFTGKDVLVEIRKAQSAPTEENMSFVKELLTFKRVELQSALGDLESEFHTSSTEAQKQDQETWQYDGDYLKSKTKVLLTKETMKKYETLLELLKDKKELISEDINQVDPDFTEIKKQCEKYIRKTEEIKKNQLFVRNDRPGKNYLQEYTEAVRNPTIEKCDNTIALLQSNIIRLQPEVDEAEKQLQGLYDAGTSRYDDSYIKNKHQLDHLLEKIETYHILIDKMAKEKSQLTKTKQE